jgi:dTDP-4-amino-4,6-dideoxygalactose transaminase
MKDVEKPALEGGRPSRKDFLIFGSPLIGEEEIAEVVATMRSGWIGTGPKVNRFEELFREYTGAKYAAALNSCTAALHLSMIVAGIGPGDEVITTPLTFCATANTVLHAGATPTFVDIDRETMNIDPEQIEKAITKNTKAILPVHLAGRPCRMDRIMALAREHGLLVIEDAAHCIEGKIGGHKIGNIGDLTCFSFYVTKNLVTGEGGMVTTNNPEWADKIRMYGLHGMSRDAWKRYSDEGFKHYQVVFPGYKYNMMDIQASMGIHQMMRLQKTLQRREEIWRRYDAAFADLPLVLPKAADQDTLHARHLYTPLLKLEELRLSRDDIMNALYKENIGTGIHYISLHLHEYYVKRFGFKKDDYPNAAYVSDRTISLPLSAKLADQDVSDVINAVTKILNYYRK